MKLNIGYSELQNYISTHYHADVSFVKVSDSEVCVSVSKKVFIKTMQVNLNLHVEEVSNNSISLSYDSGIGIDLIVSGALLFIKKKLPEYSAMVSAESGNRIRINLANIDKLQSALQVVALKGIYFTDTSVEASMSLI